MGALEADILYESCSYQLTLKRQDLHRTSTCMNLILLICDMFLHIQQLFGECVKHITD